MLVKIAVCLLVCVYACSAQLCMLSPIQRTPIGNINMPGNSSCAVSDPMPCGNTMPNINDMIYLRSGRNFSVVFQKNKNLYNPANPGYFSVSMGTPAALKEIARVPDTASPSLTMYSVPITIPTVTMVQTLIMQTKYVSNNPSAPKAYVQCSDIVLVV